MSPLLAEFGKDGGSPCRGAGARVTLSAMRTRTFTVPAELDGARLDVALAQLVPELSRSRLQGHVKSGCVTVAGAEVKRPNTAVGAGDAIELSLPEEGGGPDVSAAEQLTVLYEDEHLAVIDKEAGCVAHPSSVVRGGTVSERAVEAWGDLPVVQGADRPGIVHRLDADTTGAMVIARTDEALLALSDRFRAREVKKTYLALVHGAPPRATAYYNGFCGYAIVQLPVVRCSANASSADLASPGGGAFGP